MKVNLYYAPFPSQIFSGDAAPVNTERPLNPKSAMVTLATGIRMHAGPMGFDCEIEIIDMQVGDIPANERSQIEQALRKAGRPVSDATVLNLYIETQARKRQ